MGNMIKEAINEEAAKRIGKASAVGGVIGGGLNMTRIAFKNSNRWPAYRNSLSDSFVRGAAGGALLGTAAGAAAEYKKKKDMDKEAGKYTNSQRMGAAGGVLGAAAGVVKGVRDTKGMENKTDRAKAILKNTAIGGGLGASGGYVTGNELDKRKKNKQYESFVNDMMVTHGILRKTAQDINKPQLRKATAIIGSGLGAVGGAGAGMFTGLGRGWKGSEGKTKKERAKEIAKNVLGGGAVGAVGGGVLGAGTGLAGLQVALHHHDNHKKYGPSTR
jgi:hypothetical protein